MQDLPFASSVGSCYQAAAGEMLQTLEGLHNRNQNILVAIREQIMEIIAMERDLPLQLPNPSLCATAVCTLDLDATDVAACDQILETVTSAAIAGMNQWPFHACFTCKSCKGLANAFFYAGSVPEMALDHRRATTMVCFHAVSGCRNTVCI